MTSGRGLIASFLAVLALAALPAAAAAAPKFDAEFPVPGLETNNKIVAGPDGNMWATVHSANGDIAKITQAGAVTEFPLREGVTELDNASGITVDAQGRFWITGETLTGEGLLVRVEINRLPGEEGGLILKFFDVAQIKQGASIVLGPDKRLWVATTETVIALNPTDPDPDATKQLFAVAGLAPHDIDVSGSLLAIADQNNRIVTLTTAGVEKDYTIAGFSQGVAAFANGQIGYSASGAEPQRVGLITPPNLGPEIKTPAPGGDPFGVAVGSDGAFWFVMSAFNELARLSPGSSVLTFVKGMQAGSLARQIAPGPNNTLWVTVTKAGSEGVARFSGLEPAKTTSPPPPPPAPHRPQTRIVKRPRPLLVAKRGRAAARFEFSSPDRGAGFECKLLRTAVLHTGSGSRLQATKRKRTPNFSPCRSPKSFRVRPGSYSFEVRAVLNGLADASPARVKFRVGIGPTRAPAHHGH